MLIDYYQFCCCYLLDLSLTIYSKAYLKFNRFFIFNSSYLFLKII